MSTTRSQMKRQGPPSSWILSTPWTQNFLRLLRLLKRTTQACGTNLSKRLLSSLRVIRSLANMQTQSDLALRYQLIPPTEGISKTEHLAQLVLISVGINTRISMHWMSPSKKSYEICLLLSRKGGQRKIAPVMLTPIEVASKVKINKFKYRGR